MTTSQQTDLSAFERKCADMRETANSPAQTLLRFQGFWNMRAKEIGMEAAEVEYNECESPFKQYINDVNEHYAACSGLRILEEMINEDLRKTKRVRM